MQDYMGEAPGSVRRQEYGRSMGNALYCCFSWKGKARPGRVNRLRLATSTNFSKLSGVWPWGDQGRGMVAQNVSTL